MKTDQRNNVGYILLDKGFEARIQEQLDARFKKLRSELQYLLAKDTPDYYTALEFMELAKIGRTKFNNLREKQIIEVIKKGKKMYIPYAVAQAYFEQSSEM